MTREELLSLSEQYGTPLYVYDAAAFRRRAEQVRQALGPSTGLCYSIKANSFLLACLPEEI